MPSTSSEAHNLFLQGQYFRDRETQPDLDKAVDCYQRALALEPGYARAWAGLCLHVHTADWQQLHCT